MLVCGIGYLFGFFAEQMESIAQDSPLMNTMYWTQANEGISDRLDLI